MVAGSSPQRACANELASICCSSPRTPFGPDAHHGIFGWVGSFVFSSTKHVLVSQLLGSLLCPAVRLALLTFLVPAVRVCSRLSFECLCSYTQRLSSHCSSPVFCWSVHHAATALVGLRRHVFPSSLLVIESLQACLVLSGAALTRFDSVAV